MGLHDRLKTSNGAGGLATAELLTNGSTQEPSGPTVVQDPYAELKTRIHHACIATLGAELFKREGTGDLNERVTRAVTEQLVLDRTPLTRDERRQIIREITDDILGYGPLEPFLRDDSVTEVMVNAFDRIYVERLGKIERTNARLQTTPICCASSTRSSRRSGGESTSRLRWSTRVSPTAPASTPSSRHSPSEGRP
jgi:pilus assembly protein CpaF